MANNNQNNNKEEPKEEPKKENEEKEKKKKKKKKKYTIGISEETRKAAEELGFKKGGLVSKRTFIARGCGKVMNKRRKKTKIY